ncbi:RDD family protein [Streptomyces sp. NPDC046385]|uniref:RDD family protein n=1 Tax=Streptomyces sp. NPDC046385 TaxID=3154918 RepID=UPI00340B6251
MATPPGGGGEVPQAGYYPDPSIPGYIRFWNGGSWVPGTSRPAPKEGEALPAPPVPVAPQLAPSPAPAPSLPSVPAVEETGPVFLDADPEPSAAAQEPSSAWHATTSVQTGFGGERDQRVSWGRNDDAAIPAQQPPADPRATAAPEAPAWPQAGATPADPRQDEPRQADARQDGPRQSATRQADPRHADPRQASPRQADSRQADPAPSWPAADASVATPETPDRADRTDRPGRPGRVDRPEAGGSGGTGPGAGAAPVWPAAGGRDDAPAPVPGRSTPGAPAPANGPAAGASQDALAAPARLGGMPVTPSWAQQAQQPPQAQQAPFQAAQPAPQPPQAVQAPQAQPFPAQASPQPQLQPHPHPQPHPQPQDPQSVAPWKPPVEDVFMAAARAQAAARPAGLGRRLAARLIDTVVLGAVVGAVSYPFVTGAVDHINEKIEAAKQSGVTVQVWLIDSTTSVQFGIVLAALMVLGALYEALPTSRWGRTLGKKLCGIEVRDIEAHEPPAFGAALRRWLVYSVLGLLVLGVLNVLWCLFDRPWRQCWHDKAARTFVAG